jgi:DNA repair photolyase
VRWDAQRLDVEESSTLPGMPSIRGLLRSVQVPEFPGLTFHEVRSRSALNHVPGESAMPFPWTINPYRGCSHSCVYCYARRTHEWLEFDSGRDFDSQIVVKTNLVDVLRKELARPSWKREHVALGTNTDPYQWVESRYRLMPGIWEAMRDSGTPCSVLTKSPLLLRDIDLFKQIPSFAANLSIPTIDEKAWRASEPHTPHPRKRIEAVAELNRAGIPTGVLIAPLMPGINDSPEQVEEILELCAEAGAVSIGGICLHLRGDVRDIVMDWLRSYRPDLVPRYETLYARGAYAPKAERERLSALVREGRRVTSLRRDPAADNGSVDSAGAADADAADAEPEMAAPQPEQTSLF